MGELQVTEIKQIEMEINFYKNQAVQSIFEIGERLIKAKELVEHGEWEEWLSQKVSISNNRAREFMRVTREFSNQRTSVSLTLDKMLELTSLKGEERETFIKSNPVEDMTTRELRQAIKDKKELEQKVIDLENAPPKTVEVPPEDYQHYKDTAEQLKKTVVGLKRNLEDNNLQMEGMQKEKGLLERKVKLNEDESKKYNQLKTQIENLSKEKDDLGRQIKARTELSGLVVRIEHILKTELAPIKYSRAIREARTDEIVSDNLRDIVDRVQEWCNEMNQYTINKNIINLEVINYD